MDLIVGTTHFGQICRLTPGHTTPSKHDSNILGATKIITAVAENIHFS
jgi:hypothetical protein